MKTAIKEILCDIDHRAQLGSDVTKDEMLFFNKYYDEMLLDLKSEYEHFKYHSSKFNLKYH